MERIQKIIAASGLASRRKAEEWILAGKVTVNGEVCTLGQQADPAADRILVDGKPLPAMGRKLYIMLNKPRGYVTTLSDEKGRKTVAELVKGCGERVYPVGRLDMDSEGLLILTNDGEVANALMHPRHEIDKVYKVWVTGFSADALELVRGPIDLDGYRIRTPDVVVKWEQGTKAQLAITIHEGRNRQIRRMCENAGMQVQRLQRVRESNLSLGKLPLGAWRHLTTDEISKLIEEVTG